MLADIGEMAAQHSAGRFGEPVRAHAEMLDRKPTVYRAVLDRLPCREKKWLDRLRRPPEYDR
ncbi:MAG: hypothetical protein WA908_03000, partial [Pontixanthobacter sp.]